MSGRFSSVSARSLSVLFFISLCIRAAVFFFYVQHEERYHQSDSNDYHNGALCIAWGHGMFRPDTREPIFWRTPGYPYYVSLFYTNPLPRDTSFSGYAELHKNAIWVQIVINAFIPLVILFLALLLTGSSVIAWLAAWLSAFHLGLVLSSTYLLSEGMGLIFFYLFLVLLFAVLLQSYTRWRTLMLLSLAAVSLGVFTWMRPMGESVALLSALMIIIFLRASWKMRVGCSLLFLSIFFASIFGWYLRNHQLTGQWFFWKGSGPVLCAFTGPKVLRDIEGTRLEDGVKLFLYHAQARLLQDRQLLRGTGLYASQEYACAKVGVPFILAHPWWAMYEWTKEVIKTAFDPFASQLVNFASHAYTYDLIEEFLPTKIADCMYAQEMPVLMRVISLLDVLFMLLMWLGVFAGFWVFVVRGYRTYPVYCRIWLLSIPFCILVIGLTGGFGYARLRLPVEPLLFIMALVWWHWLFNRGTHNDKEQNDTAAHADLQR